MTDQFERDAALAIADLALAGTPEVAAGKVAPPHCIFLTGATGFLGVAVLAGLLEKTRARVLCLVRGLDEVEPQRRLSEVFLAATGQPLPVGRVLALPGDLALPGLGMTAADAARVANEAGVAIHCGAEVKWSRSYAELRAVNVLSVLELARLCCRPRPKPVVFVSTLAVCYAQDAPERVDEDVEMSRYLAGMPLAYARGKCVAEHILGAFGRSGLPVTIVRSGLIIGDSRDGRSNPDDIVSRMLCSAARNGIAPDVDWKVDACPVDFVADVLVELARAPETGMRTLHVHHPSPRHWREVVAWLNVAGYCSSLVPYKSWLDQVKRATFETDPYLQPLSPFFLARPRILGGQTLPELYFEANRERIDANRSRTFLAQYGLSVPAIDGRYLSRCVDALAASGHIPKIPSLRPKARRSKRTGAEATIASLLREYFGTPGLSISGMQKLTVNGGIIGELLAWKLGTEAGVTKYEVSFRRRNRAPVEKFPLILKRKPGDEVMLAIGEALARTCGAVLGKTFVAGARGLGMLQAHKREPSLYCVEDQRLRRCMPSCYGSMVEPGGDLFALAIECLDPAAFPAWAEAGQSWPHEPIRSVVDAAALIHSVFLGRTRALGKESWHSRCPSLEEMQPLWLGLADHASEFFSDWWGEPSLQLQLRAAKTVRIRRDALAAIPQTVAHNDFNPRNLAFRPDSNALRPCAFDWEFAGVRVPQHDLAELLCFVLPPEADAARVAEYLELHRQRLSDYSGIRLDRDAWLRGFALSLDELILERFPLYALFHRVRRQPYLSKVLQNWRRLRDWFEPMAKSTISPPGEAVL